MGLTATNTAILGLFSNNVERNIPAKECNKKKEKIAVISWPSICLKATKEFPNMFENVAINKSVLNMK